jgi:hypothetical protein
MIVYLYAQTSEAIRQLKLGACETVTEEKYVYPPGHTQMDCWQMEKVKVERVVRWMSPRHERWQEYRNAKRRATLILAARLILKANNGIVPEKVGTLLSMRIFRSHARTAAAQKSLAYASYRYLRKLDNRLRNQPQRFTRVAEWWREREERRVRREG